GAKVMNEEVRDRVGVRMVVGNHQREIFSRRKVDRYFEPASGRVFRLSDLGRNPEAIATAEDADSQTSTECRADDIKTVGAAAWSPQRPVANAIGPLSRIARNLQSTVRQLHRRVGLRVRVRPAAQRV